MVVGTSEQALQVPTMLCLHSLHVETVSALKFVQFDSLFTIECFFDTANHINHHFLQYQRYYTIMYKLNKQIYEFKTTILAQYWKLMNNEK